MANDRDYTFLDRLTQNVDRVVRTLGPSVQTGLRESPAQSTAEASLTSSDKKHAAGLMRVNHTGEVMAQGLYQGQALTAKLPEVREEMEQAAREEEDHLAWCEERVRQLDSHRSVLNPLWYGLSFGMGAAAGLAGDKYSLGFVAAIEDQVCDHLRGHLNDLPEQDEKSRAIVTRMLEEEEKHGQTALRAGGVEFPKGIKKGMTIMSRLMTRTSYRI